MYPEQVSTCSGFFIALPQPARSPRRTARERCPSARRRRTPPPRPAGDRPCSSARRGGRGSPDSLRTSIELGNEPSNTVDVAVPICRHKAALFLEISGKADSLLDAYSSIRVALAVAEAFGCSVNELPLTLVLSWYEQKAVCILLTLLSLGIKNIYLSPSLPVFLSETVEKVLVDTYGLQPITAPEQDMDAILHRG